MGVPLDAGEMSPEDVRGAGLEIGDAGIDLAGRGEKKIQRYIGLSVGLPIRWDGEWAQGVTGEEFEDVLGKVHEGLRGAGIDGEPRLFFLVNYN